jgi:hypothetical protein
MSAEALTLELAREAMKRFRQLGGGTATRSA